MQPMQLSQMTLQCSPFGVKSDPPWGQHLEE
jgi:hypothetical protein